MAKRGSSRRTLSPNCFSVRPCSAGAITFPPRKLVLDQIGAADEVFVPNKNESLVLRQPLDDSDALFPET